MTLMLLLVISFLLVAGIDGLTSVYRIATSRPIHRSHQSLRQGNQPAFLALYQAADSNGDASDTNADTEDDVVQALQSKAEKLRQEVATLQKEKQDALDVEQRQIDQEIAEKLEIKSRYSATVPIFKEDGSTQMESVEFSPLFVSDQSKIEVCTASLPLGMILGEYDGTEDDDSNDDNGVTSNSIRAPIAMRVNEVAPGSNAEAAGVQVGDLLRACTATQTIMETPTWQVLVGGIGMPKTKRFMYSVDGRPFEEVMDAIASNRMDPEERDVVLVFERL